jgi:hypothetical protein
LASELRTQWPDLSIRQAIELTYTWEPTIFPTPSPKSRKEVDWEKLRRGISNGPGCKAAQFGYSDNIRPEMLEDMGSVVNEMNVHLTHAHSQVRVHTGRVFKNVVHFNLNKVPNQPEFDRIKECFFKALKKDTPEGDNPTAPQSIAHLIFKGFNYYTNRFNRRPEDVLSGDKVIEMMSGVEQLRGLECVRKPSVVKSRGSNDMAVVFIDVWDSKNGLRTKNIVNKVYHIGGKLIKVEYARQREFVLQCQRCWAWSHGTSRCRINHQRCARCGQGHMTENHNQFSTCCGAIRKERGVNGVECEHKLKCLNCIGEHTADSSKCVYKRHQNNRAWHDRRAEVDRQVAKERKERRNANITQALQMPASQIIEVDDSQ